VRLGQFGFFQHGAKNCTVWLHPQPEAGRDTAVLELQAALAAAYPSCNEVGSISPRGFRPHLSVGQWGGLKNCQKARAQLQTEWDAAGPLDWLIDRVSRMIALAHAALPMGSGTTTHPHLVLTCGRCGVVHSWQTVTVRSMCGIICNRCPAVLYEPWTALACLMGSDAPSGLRLQLRRFRLQLRRCSASLFEPTRPISQPTLSTTRACIAALQVCLISRDGFEGPFKVRHEVPLGTGLATWDAGAWRPFAASLPPAPAGVPPGGRAQVGVSKRPPGATSSGAGTVKSAGSSVRVESASKCTSDDRMPADPSAAVAPSCTDVPAAATGAPAALETVATLASVPGTRAAGGHGGLRSPSPVIGDPAAPTAVRVPVTGKRGKAAPSAGAAAAAASPHGRPPPLAPSAYVAFGTDWHTADATSKPAATSGADPRNMRDGCRALPHITFAGPAPEVLLPDTGPAAVGSPTSAGAGAASDGSAGADTAAATSRGGHGRSRVKGIGQSETATKLVSVAAGAPSAPMASIADASSDATAATHESDGAS
jgi:hypothetical protein